MAIYDFHTHTSLSDGGLSPMEMIRRAAAAGYQAIALTDHAAPGDMARIIAEVSQVCALARQYWNITAIPGIELTHVPAAAIDEAAKQAKNSGAWIVVVHGETMVEPVEKGTNLAAIKSAAVDILAHPGLISLEEVELAARRGIFLEISARRGHCLSNGHVARLAGQAGAKLLLDSDAHMPGDLLAESFAGQVLAGAGLDKREHEAILSLNPQELLKKLQAAHPAG